MCVEVVDRHCYLEVAFISFESLCEIDHLVCVKRQAAHFQKKISLHVQRNKQILYNVEVFGRG